LLPLLLAGCAHKPHQAQQPPVAPPIELPVPAPAPEPTPAETTPPVETPVQVPAPETKPPEEPAKPPVHHKKRVSKPAEETAPEPAGVSAIGQLSSGDSGDLRQETDDSIASTERGLKAITRRLSAQEQKTVVQIKEFLKQARSALGSGDVDGAHTLALKANVLLSELSQ
jgi:outer membrane biosynthesis protein TonB